MLLQKTDKGLAELRPGARTLGSRERCMLLLCNGHQSLMDARQMFEGQGERNVLGLVRDGYLAPVRQSRRTNGRRDAAPL